MADIPATIDLNPTGNEANASVIWLHGLGANGHDFVPVVDRFDERLQSSVRFIFPHAPIRPVSVNGGVKMPAWYDIFGIDLNAKEDRPGIDLAEEQIRLLIKREQQLGIKNDRIVLAGFSQGAALSLYTGLRLDVPLAGIVFLSGYLPIADHLLKTLNHSNQSTPIFIAHGLFDHLVPFSFGEIVKKSLVSLHYSVEWQSYPMAHTVSTEEIDDINGFLLKVLGFS